MFPFLVAAFKSRQGSAYRDAVQTENFRVSLIHDVAFAELSGALKVRTHDWSFPTIFSFRPMLE